MMKEKKYIKKIAATLTAAAVIQPAVSITNTNCLTVLAAEQSQPKETKQNQAKEKINILKKGTMLTSSAQVAVGQGQTTSAAVYLNNDIDIEVDSNKNVIFLIEDIRNKLAEHKKLNVKLVGKDFQVIGDILLKNGNTLKDCGWITDHAEEDDDFVTIKANTQKNIIDKYTLEPFTYMTIVSLNINQNPPVDKNEVVLSKLRIKGSTTPGSVLSAEVKDDNDNDVISELSYRWYRVDKIGAVSETLVGEKSTYTVQTDDIGKYIKLVASNSTSYLVAFSEQISTNNSTENNGDSSSSNSGSNSSGGGGGSSSGNSSNSTSSNSENTNSNKETITVEKNINGQIELKNSDGDPVSGWQKVDGKWYLGDEKGQAMTGWQQVNEKWYLMNNDGEMTTGWQQTDNGKWYLMNNSGEMTTGWQQTNGKWYLMNNSGEMTTGWQQTNGKWYLMNNSGEMTTGWQQTNGKWYLMSNSGEMTTGWQKVNGKWYYLNKDGSMASNTYVNGYYVGNDGAWVK